MAIKPDGKVKMKGIYAQDGLSKNPTNLICMEAVTAYLTASTPLRHTIQACTDIRRFLSIRQVKGGGTYGGQYLGKVVRWYYADGETRHIEYATNGNKVAKSEGAKPLMDLPDSMPADIDYDWYVDEARSILADVGAW